MNSNDESSTPELKASAVLIMGNMARNGSAVKFLNESDLILAHKHRFKLPNNLQDGTSRRAIETAQCG